MDELRKIPPLTRYLTLGSLAVRGATALQLVSPYTFLLHWPAVTSQFQLWRIWTNFLFVPGPGISFLFDIYLLYRYSNELEKGIFYEKTADYTWFLWLLGASCMALSYPLKLSVLSRSGLLGIVHYWGQSNAAQQVSLYGIVNIPAKFFSFALLALDVISAGPAGAAAGFIGIIAAQGLYYLREIYPRDNNGRTFPALATPNWLIRKLGNGPTQPAGNIAPTRGGGVRLGGGTVFPAARQGGPSSRGSGSTTTTAQARAPPTTSTGYSWGSGNRLGSE